MNSSSVSPAAIVAGALVAQVSVVVIMFIGASIIRRDASLVRWYKGLPTYSNFAWLILTLLLLSAGVLAFSDGLSSSWRPLLGDLEFVGIAWSRALLIVFLADIAILTILVAGTGGSIDSPFQPLYFLLPTLALLLREPTTRVLLYSGIVALSFLWLLFRRTRLAPEDDRVRSRVAYGVVGILCLTLACFIGLYTRAN